MFNMEYYFSMYMFFICCFMVSFYLKHLLLTIISLEFIMVSLLYNMYIILMNIEVSLYLMIFVLIFMVCEGALSLTLIILLVRLFGNDYLNSLNLIKW